LSKLSKDDPAYYKAEVNKLIKQAKNNGLQVGYEINSRAEKILNIKVLFENYGYIAGANIYDESWDKEEDIK
jgi:hypothetical protein